MKNTCAKQTTFPKGHHNYASNHDGNDGIPSIHHLKKQGVLKKLEQMI